MNVHRPRATRRGSRVDWVKFDAELARDGSVDPVDKALYAAIASFVDTDTRESPETLDVDPNAVPDDVPTRKRLAECVGRSVDTIDRATKRLEERGLLRVHKQPDPDNPKRMLPSEYELLDHELWDERAAARKEARAARRMAAEGDPSSSGGSRTHAATPGRMGAATPGRMGAAVKEEREVKEEKRGEAPSARSAGDARRASTGSTAREAREGGSAASGGAPAPRRSTSASGAAVRALVASLPEELRSVLPAGVPKALSEAITAELDGRTVDQLLTRVDRRWYTHGYAAAADTAAGGSGLARPVGVAVALVRAGECPDARCEDGVNIDTGAACPRCAERHQDPRHGHCAPGVAASRLVPAQETRTAVPHPECVDCETPMRTPTSDGRCAESRAAAATITAVLSV